MKALKRLLLLALALIMCMSLFACSDDPDNDNPIPDGPVVDNTDDSNLTAIENDYIVDYQVLEDGKFYVEFDGAEPTEVLYGGSSTPEEDMYQPFWNIVDGKIEIVIEGDMMGSKADKVLKFKTDKNKYSTYLTINPITDNYFIVDGTADTFKVAIEGIVSAKFGGVDVASVTGITKDETGLTFTKDLLATKLGHNKLEVKTDKANYVVSVCAVTKKQVAMPITFEDGKMTPFMAVFGNDYKVIKDVDVADETVKLAYAGDGRNPAEIYYVQGPNSTRVENDYMLEIDHKAGSPEELRVYVSSFYLKERLAAMKTHDATIISDGNRKYFGDKAAAQFERTYYFTLRVFASAFNANQGGINDYYSIVSGKDIKSSEDVYIAMARGGTNCKQNNRILCNKEMYDMMIDANGNLIETYQAMAFRDADNADGHKIYIDDVTGSVWGWASHFLSMAIPEIA